MLVLLSLACASGGAKVILPDDTAGVVDVDTSDTAAGDSGSGDTADTTDTSPPVEDLSGRYAGRVDGTLEPLGDGDRQPPASTCSGDVDVTLSATGALSGDASCATRDGWGPSGSLAGTATGGVVSATWTVDSGRDTMEMPLTGTVGGGHLVLAGVGEDRRMRLTVEMDGAR